MQSQKININKNKYKCNAMGYVYMRKISIEISKECAIGNGNLVFPSLKKYLKKKKTTFFNIFDFELESLYL